MTYRTQGTIAMIKWSKEECEEAGQSASDTLCFTIDPVAPYLFEENEGGKTKKFVLLADETNRAVLKKKDATKTDFVIDFEGTTMCFAELFLLKQNRSKVEIYVKESEKLFEPLDGISSKDPTLADPTKGADSSRQDEAERVLPDASKSANGNGETTDNGQKETKPEEEVIEDKINTTFKDDGGYNVVKLIVK